MKHGLTILLATVWLLAATVVLAYVWLNHPDVHPSLPDGLINWAIGFYGPRDAEEIADLETLIALILWFGVVSLVTAAVFFLWHHGRHD